ncbi:BON domain-containing protein [Streptomyces sp. NPDC003038]|uniref:BON domain-containing protein n=1 Tax=unclassified Streptomyces TaxID=2593676 RepID=UPI0033AEA158
MTSTEIIDYRIQHLRDRLAREDIAELGVRIEIRGGRALLWGSVSTAECRSAVLRLAAEELAGVPWHDDLTVNCPDPPAHPEELS